MTRPRSLSALRRLTVAALALFALGACDGWDVTPPREGATRVLLTDAPFPYGQVSRADIHIVSVSAATGSGATKRVIVTPGRTYDLVALQHGRTADLGEGFLTPATYGGVTLEIDTERSSFTLSDGTVIKGNTLPGGIWWRSPEGQARTSFDVTLASAIEVTRVGATLIIDFDLGRSFRPADPVDARAGFIFTPFARGVSGNATGSVTGTITGDDGTPVTDAMVSLFVDASAIPWATARTDATGRFRIAFLPGRTYRLSAEAPLTSPYGASSARDVPVIAPTETDVGIVAIPRLDLLDVTGVYVARRVGFPESSRQLPAAIFPGPASVWLDADTLRLDATGAGTEVTVQRRANPGTTPVTYTTQRTTQTLTYDRRGRVITLRYPCPSGNCVEPPQGVLEGTRLTVYWPEVDGTGLSWPREFERVSR